MWERVTQWSYPMGSAAGWNWPARLSTARPFWFWNILHWLCEINRHGTTIIMATHAKEFVNLLRKRVITLVDGQIWGDVQKGRYGDIV